MGRLMRIIKRMFSCMSETRGGNGIQVVHIQPIPVRESTFVLNRIIYRRRGNKNKKSIAGIIKILNMDDILDDNDMTLDELDSMIEVKEIGVYTKDDINISCTICLEKIDYMNNINFIEPCCGQVYHSHCITKWVEESQCCPICKNPLLVCYLN